MDRETQATAALADLTARFSLGWLVVANLVGLLLATLLLWPELNDTLTPFSYGRWMPVHHNAQLYGWCALPLVGLLLRAFLVPGVAANGHTLVALASWSGALAFGAASWLGGNASGKLFLDWTGPARIAFPLALTVLWAVLAHHAFRRLAAEKGFGFQASRSGSDLSPNDWTGLPPASGTGLQTRDLVRGRDLRPHDLACFPASGGAGVTPATPTPAQMAGGKTAPPQTSLNVEGSAFTVRNSARHSAPPSSAEVAEGNPHSALRSPRSGVWFQPTVFSFQPSPHLVRFALLAVLLLVPTILHFSAGPRTFPPVNPDSGGATGVSLYGSTLGLVLVFAAVPWMVALPLRRGARRARLTWPVLGAAMAVFATANHGHGSHHDRDQIITLGLLFLAPPLLARDWRRFIWSPEARGWLIASLVWGVLLVADGWITFLPAISERLKFTNGLVAHSHLAMAGLLTSLNAVFLLHLGESPRVHSALGARAPFWLWQLAAAAHIAVLLTLGWSEGADPWLVQSGGTAIRHAYLTRLFAGAAMTVASLWWLSAMGRAAPRTVPVPA